MCPLIDIQSTPDRDTRPGKTTKNRDNDESQPLPVITLNQSQLLSGIDSSPSQPKSGNDTGRRSAHMCQPLDTGRRSTHVSTHGHGQEEVPEVSKL